MKKLKIYFITLLLISCTKVFAQSDLVTGIWLTEKSDSQIHIFRSDNGKFYGKIVWLKEDINAKDDKNPHVKLRDCKLLGLQILKGFEYDGIANEWNKGTIYDPESGKTYDCFMRFNSGSDQLSIKGYVLGMRFLGRETTWKRESSIRK